MDPARPHRRRDSKRYLATRGAGSVGSWLFYAVLALAPAVALAVRRRPDEYRSALVAGVVLLGISFILGGIIIGALYLPTLLFTVAALGTNAFARRHSRNAG